jgi:multidrug efflux pump subunit AcrB
VVEVPPGPPVMSPLVAEVYGPDAARGRELARKLAEQFARQEGIVDIDTTVEADAPRQIVVVDRQRAARLGVSQAQIVAALGTALGGTDATWLRDGAAKYPVPVRLRLPAGDQAEMDRNCCRCRCAATVAPWCRCPNWCAWSTAAGRPRCTTRT